MSIPIKVYSDYVCPFCFLGEFPLKEAVQGRDVEVERMPFELRPAPNPTLRPEGQYLQQAWRNSVYPMAERMGVEIRLPRVPPHQMLPLGRLQPILEHRLPAPLPCQEY